MGELDHIAALFRHWYVIVVSAVILGVVAFFIAANSPKEYVSSTEVFLVGRAGPGVDVVQAGTMARSLAPSLTAVATSDAVLDPVLEELDLDATRGSLAGRVRAEVEADSSVIRVSVTAADPDEAADTANAVTRHFSTEVSALTGEVAAEVPGAEDAEVDAAGVSPVLMSEATPNPNPTAPDTVVHVAVGTFAGLVLGTVLALLLGLRRAARATTS